MSAQIIPFRRRNALPSNPAAQIATGYFIGIAVISLIALAVFDSLFGVRRG